MMIDKNKYRKTLTELWQGVFGDEDGFIDLIFKSEYDSSIICFAELVGEKAVSAFYLIRNELLFEGKLYNGYYLYAAATLPEYRKCRLMSELIQQAQQFCRTKNVDFISLVPSEESLYSYYSRFGFQSAMYRYECSNFIGETADNDNKIIVDSNTLLDMRRCYKNNIINFSQDTFFYATDCLKYAGFEFTAVSDNGYLCYSDEDASCSELFVNIKESEISSKNLADKKGIFTSPFALCCFEECVIKPYGMIFPINPELVRDWNFKDIYMNMALD